MIDQKELLEALRRGEPLVAGRGNPGTAEAAPLPADPRTVVAASDLRSVLIAAARSSGMDAADPRGLCLTGAVVTGRLDLDNLTLAHDLKFFDCLFTGAVSLVGARVAGGVAFSGSAILGADRGCSLSARLLDVAGQVRLDSGFRTSGAVVLASARIASELSLSGARLQGVMGTGWSLQAQGIDVRGGVVARAGFVSGGAMSLSGANIGGQLVMDDARIDGAERAGWSLNAQNMRAEGNVHLHENFRTAGAVSLSGAHIAGHLSLRAAQLGSPVDAGWSLNAQNAEIAASVHLTAGFCAAGAVTFSGAHVSRQFNTAGARIEGAVKDVSLDLLNLRGDGDVFLSVGTALSGKVLLAGSRTGCLVLPRDGEPPAVESVAGWQLADVVGKPRTDRSCAARWLEGQSTAQPWLELASFYDRIGQPSDARWMRYRSAVRTTGHGSRWSKPGRWLYRITTGHGYYAAPLTLGWLLAIFLTAWAITASHPDDFTTATTAAIRQDVVDQQKAAGVANPPPVPGRVPASAWNAAWDTPEFQPWTYALSTAVPTTSSATSQPWTPQTGWLSAVLAVLRSLSWIFTALFLAGITGLLRKQT